MFKVLIYNFYVFISIIGLNQINQEKIPLIIDADTANELDDLFAIARAVSEPKFNIFTILITKSSPNGYETFGGICGVKTSSKASGKDTYK